MMDMDGGLVQYVHFLKREIATLHRNVKEKDAEIRKLQDWIERYNKKIEEKADFFFKSSDKKSTELGFGGQ